MWALTGCRKGLVPAALVEHGPAAAGREIDRMIEAFGRDRVLVELWDHGDPLDSARNDALVELALKRHVGIVATTNAHYATPAQRRLATALAAVRVAPQPRRPRSVAAGVGRCAPAIWRRDGAPLRPLSRRRRARGRGRPGRGVRPQARRPVATAVPVSRRVDRDALPAPDRRGGRSAPLRRDPRAGAREDLSLRARAWKTIDRELDIIEHLGFAGYFLVVWDLVEFCRQANIFCQGRGSAANSAVCYALGVTAADAVSLGLLFERFLSPERDGPPDIDIDIESDRREEVIQYVYNKHGRHHTAQVANVITYRARSAIRDMAKALGYSPGQQDAWSKRIDGWGTVATTAEENRIRPHRMQKCTRMLGEIRFRRRCWSWRRRWRMRRGTSGSTPGGMVICDRPVIEVCPVEWGRMQDRSRAAVGQGRLRGGRAREVRSPRARDAVGAALRRRPDRASTGDTTSTWRRSRRRTTSTRCSAAPTPSACSRSSRRAQMATLPRLKPRRFYDLVVEVALIRPGPIQGGSVHPYIRRRNGQEPITYLHPLLENSLGKTLGVPLFQEQLMQMAIDVAGFTPAESDELRQAMGSKRSAARMEKLRERLYAGMAERGITGDIADQIYVKMKAFANYGFPESHSVSFAYLVYASSWIKYHEPAAFCAALLNAQPMGFWSPHSLVRDARRHGVVVRGPDLNVSLATATLEEEGTVVRLGLKEVRGIGRELADEIERVRLAPLAEGGGDYRSPEDLVRRVPALTLPQLESLATADAFACFGLDRRQALWTAGSVAQSRPGRLPGVVTGATAPQLPGMSPAEEAVADLWSTGIATDCHPTQFLRDQLTKAGVLTSTQLHTVEPGAKVKVAGVVTHRQRPMTAQGVTFLNLEDETGLINIVVSKGCWTRFRRVAQESPAMTIRGRLERAEGVVNIVAEHMEYLVLPGSSVHASRDFR